MVKELARLLDSVKESLDMRKIMDIFLMKILRMVAVLIINQIKITKLGTTFVMERGRVQLRGFAKVSTGH